MFYLFSCQILVYNGIYIMIGELNMLDMKKTQQMTDIIHNSIPYSGIEDSVISTPVYNRLHRVLQSSLVFLTYPSNKVKRFEHSIGTMHLAGNMFFNSLCNASSETFTDFMNNISCKLVDWRKGLSFDLYSFVAAELRPQLQGCDILTASVPESDFYNKFRPGILNPDQEFAFFVTFQAVRLAGLLHDIGHLPYSHILEHALKRMYVHFKEKEHNSEVEKSFLSIMQRFADGDDEIHEEIGKLLVDTIRNSITQNIVDRSDPNIFFFLASFDFAKNIICSKPSDNTIFSDLHMITSSVVDADRLDYCSRDSYCSGTNKSVYLYDRLLYTYKLEQIKEDGITRFYFCPSIKSISHVEDLLRRRQNIFSEINYHHRVHKHEVLLEEVISTLGIRELESMQSINQLPNTLPLYISSIWQLISKLKYRNDWPEYQIIQLDDSWLDTLLKYNFFEIYGIDYLSLRKNGNDVLWNRFDELISSTKRYHSLIKRTNDFREFDKDFFAKLKEAIIGLKEKENTSFPILSTYKDFFDKYHSFVFNFFVENICITDAIKENFFKSFEEEINLLVCKKEPNLNNCLLRNCMFSFGYGTVKTPLYLSDSNNNTIRIEKVSSQLEIFQKERAISPIFHLYYLPKYNKQYNVYFEINKSNLFSILADAAVNTILKFLY